MSTYLEIGVEDDPEMNGDCRLAGVRYWRSGRAGIVAAERIAGDSKIPLSESAETSAVKTCRTPIRSYLKKVFWPELFVGASF